MKSILFLGLLLQSALLQANISVPSLSKLVNCSHSVFHGEVMNGKFTKPKQPSSEELGYGSYKIKVIEHIAGKILLNQVTLQADYFKTLDGGFSSFYPAPGKQYIFVVAKDGRGLKFSPHHLPEVENIQGKDIVTGGQHRFLEGVDYYYKESDGGLKEGGHKSNINDGNFVGYNLYSYKDYIATEFGKCTTGK